MPAVYSRNRNRETPRIVIRGGARALRFHLAEQWLEARRESWFPTNGMGPDEDVNVYVADRLARFVLPNGTDGSVLAAPAGKGPAHAARAEAYRCRGDALLMHLGLFGHAGGLRRRRIPWGWTRETVDARDRRDMITCYEAAAALLERAGAAAPAATLRRIADHADGVIAALTVLATRRLGWGSLMDSGELEDLARGGDAQTVHEVMRPVAGPAETDVLLDLILEYRRRPSADLRRRLVALAAAAGVPADALPPPAG